MIVNNDDVGGKIIKDNEKYILQDNTFLKNLTLSKTILKPGQSTTGHKHDGLDEVYMFLSGSGKIQIGDVLEKPGVNITQVSKGSIALIPEGQFHRVFNGSDSKTLEFICVFQSYERA